MLSFIFRRFLSAIPTLFLIVTISFFLIRLAPGGPFDLERPLEQTLRERLATAFHPACSCAIGPVVDERLRVLGVDGLRVADASVFPRNVTNNTNLTCFMIGERAAALIDEETGGRRSAEAVASQRSRGWPGSSRTSSIRSLPSSIEVSPSTTATSGWSHIALIAMTSTACGAD